MFAFILQTRQLSKHSCKVLKDVEANNSEYCIYRTPGKKTLIKTALVTFVTATSITTES